ncbi:DNA repair protein SWI5 homolog isoform X2 [Rhinatrema bivittatum]|uniref:DNA repair protein SWI5 homolog isoform X2 n=1 Tax=Rhinatrema bivittatum TaxID=194408 RepID=UPI00112BB9B8|nr:DNA repair protein SWI5 homolog isoform X2 [Rhinatrema bivittatum]
MLKSSKSRFRLPIQSPRTSKVGAISEETIRQEITDLKERDSTLSREAALLVAEGYNVEELDKHISLLHQYNDLRDTGQLLLGRLALRGVTTKDLYLEFEMELED